MLVSNENQSPKNIKFLIQPFVTILVAVCCPIKAFCEDGVSCSHAVICRLKIISHFKRTQKWQFHGAWGNGHWLHLTALWWHVTPGDTISTSKGALWSWNGVCYHAPLCCDSRVVLDVKRSPPWQREEFHGWSLKWGEDGGDLSHSRCYQPPGLMLASLHKDLQVWHVV